MAFLLQHIPAQGLCSIQTSVSTGLDVSIRHSRKPRAQCACWQRSQAAPRPLHLSSQAPASRASLAARSSPAQPQASTSTVGGTVRAGEADMQWGSFVSCQPSLQDAVQEAVAAIQQSLGQDCEPQLALVFASAGYGPDVDRLVELLRLQVPSLRHVFGCTAYGVIGSTPTGPQEVEGSPSLSLTLGRLPGVDISVVHTLRSNIPSEDASPEQWAQLVGVPLHDQRPLSFMVLADPRFQQVKPLLAGLDFAFPGATKIGGMLSSGQRHKRRTMFAWSADGPGTRLKRRSGQQRRRQGRESRVQQRQQRQQEQQRLQRLERQRQQEEEEQQRQLERQQEEEQQRQQQQQRKRRRGIFGLVDRFVAGISGAVADAAAAAAAALEELEDEENEGEQQEEDEEEDEGVGASSSGVHMYGTAIMALQGNVVLEPITSQGYRTVGDKVWTIERVAKEGTAIVAITDTTDASTRGGSIVSSSSVGTAMDSRDEEVTTPLIALFYLLEQLGKDKAMTDLELEDLSAKLAVAVAPDALSADATIAPDDFQVMEVKYIDDDDGAISVDGEVRTGYRMKLVLRDREGIEQDLRNKLLATKKRDLMQAMIGGGLPQRPAFGALLFADIERGEELYGSSGFESGLLGQYLPVPVSGMFGSAEISSVNRKTSVYELTCAIGVLRVATEEESGSGMVPSESGTAAAEQQQQQEQQDGS